MHPSQAEYLCGLKQRLEATPYRGRGRLINEAAALLSVSRSVVYARLEKIGWESGRKTRSDCGRLCVNEDLAVLAGGILKAATRANGKRIMSIHTVTEILDKNGLGCVADAETGEVAMPSPATLSRAMTAYGCHPDQLKRGSPAISLRSPHPNWCWQMDASVCVIFYLPRGRVRIMEEAVYNKNKPKNLEKAERARVIRWVITDHHSGMVFCRYALGAEDAASALAVLIEAMCRRENETDIFHGVPFVLYTDKGAPFIADLTKGFCARLRIKLIDHARGNARATGQVESGQRIVERQFESRLRFMTVDSLEELNRRADEWRVTFNACAIHSRHRKPRALLWTSITPEQLRVPQSGEALRALVASPAVERTVSGRLSITYAIKGWGQQTYNLHGIEGVNIGDKVSVSVNPYEAPAVDVAVRDMDGGERIYMLAPIKRDKAGFDVDAPVVGEDFARHRDTATDKAIKRMEREAFAAATPEEAEKARRAGRPAYAGVNIMADIEARRVPLFFPVRGGALDLDAPQRETQPLTIAEAGMRLKRRMATAGLPWEEKHMEHLIRSYPGGHVPVEDVEALAAAFIRPAGPAVVEFEAVPRQAAGGAA